jgi:hypothetical protein
VCIQETATATPTAAIAVAGGGSPSLRSAHGSPYRYWLVWQLGSASRVCLTECIEELPEGLRLAGSEQLLVGLTNAEKSVSSQTLIRCGVAPVGICRRFAELMDGAQAAVWLRPHGLTRFPCCHSFGRRVSRRRVSALGKRGNRQRVVPRTSGAATKERGKGHVYHSRTRFTGRPR